ncbi:MAG: site-2 protease family protein [Candidatus Woesearchaeota archaeon]|nr:site-2 protease family protein [Candidatus Woesearchaeota archaeon]
MNYDILAFLIFIAILSIVMYKNKKRLSLQKVLYPFVYIILYKTQLGIGFMKRLSSRHRQIIVTIAYCFIGFAFAGMIFISYAILRTMIQFIISPKTTQTGMALIYPGTQIPGIGYLTFWYWLIGLFIIALVHELAHGIVAVANKIKIKSSGFAVLGIIAPLFPAAFVEPDEKEMRRRPPIQQYSVLAAGPMINLLIALLLFALMPYVADSSNSMLAPFESRMTVPAGFSFTISNASMPAGQAGLVNNTLIISVNGANVTSADSFIEQLYYCTKPGQEITLASYNASYTIKTIESPVENGRAYIGVENLRNIRAVAPGYRSAYPVFAWFKGLFKWLFLLNFFIGLTNLLPIFITDGARMLQVALEDIITDKKKADRIWSVINWMFFALIVIGLLSTYFKKFF